MAEKDFNELFSKNLNFFLNLNQKSQSELADYIGVSTASVSNWCKGIKMPRMDKIDKICLFFKIKRSDLIEDKPQQQEEHYYLNEETREIAQEIFENKDMRSLFDMSRKMTPGRLKAHLEFMKNLQEEELE